MMRLKVITPTAVCIDCSIRRLIAEAPNGLFGMLPGHIDFVTALMPSVMTYETDDGNECFVALRAGTLVKAGETIRVAVRGAVQGGDLSALRQRVEQEFRHDDDDERVARSALARLEVNMVRRFVDLKRRRP